MNLSRLRDARDHFDRFGVARAFDLSESDIQSRYLELCRLTHPDFAGGSEEKQLLAMELSATVNEAYRVLMNPRERGEYLVMLLDGVSGAEDRTLPDGFLDEVLSLRESLAEAGGILERTQTIMDQVHRRRHEVISLISQAFSLAEASQACPTARMLLNALKYLDRMIEQHEA